MTLHRSHYEIPLRPAASSGRFQPTGFPSLGAALFQRPVGEDGWQDCLHVESPQSMANRLELTTWDEARQRPIAELEELPVVEVIDGDGRFLTSSRVEPHRLNSAYIMEGIVGDTAQTGYDWLPGVLGLEDKRPADHAQVARAVYRLDPLSLIHGVFFAQNKGGWFRQPKFARAVTAFIDATDVMPAVSGGVKTDYVDTSGGHADTGYGMVPHSRVEYTARHITAHVTVDHQQIRAYGLGEPETELLEAIIGFELASLFGAGGLRLRTACEFLVVENQGTQPDLDVERAKKRLVAAIEEARDTLGEVVTLRHGGDKGARSKETRARKAAEKAAPASTPEAGKA
ncbi:MAG: type I-U CRISPR-associated RAMP protein Csb1/Cas7u [Mobilicoccus sp.]|nr:type I-U CRISPR-associated RAMP protein Csb1/Cas7u [Mobilicoccus sp.]